MYCPHDDYTETLMNAVNVVRICNLCGREMVYHRAERKEDVEKRWEG
jgi:hypothetical protein